MIDQRLLELIHADLDGVASPEQAATLRELLAGDEEARAYRDELVQLSSALNAVEPIDPPIDLADTVMSTLRRGARSPGGAQQRGGMMAWLAPFVQTLRSHAGLRYGYSFAGGLALGALLIITLGRASAPSIPAGDSLVSGAMLRGSELHAYEPVDDASFTVGDTHGVLETRFADGIVVATLELQTVAAIEIVVDFDGTLLALRGFDAAEPRPVELGLDRIRVRHSGQNTYVARLASLADAPSHVEIRCYASGVLVAEERLHALPVD